MSLPVRKRPRSTGFTLVEVLVAMLIMAVLATLSWQGLDAILRGREASNAALDRSTRLATAVAQFEQDLQAVVEVGALAAPLTFDGQSLRMVRRSERGVQVVVWALRQGRWQRWISPPVQQVGELQNAWRQTLSFQGQEAGQLLVAEGVDSWQVFFNWGGAWSNAQSTGEFEVISGPALPAAPAPAASGASAPAAGAAASAPSAIATQVRVQVPDAVRLLLSVGGSSLRRDVLTGRGA